MDKCVCKLTFHTFFFFFTLASLIHLKEWTLHSLIASFCVIKLVTVAVDIFSRVLLLVGIGFQRKHNKRRKNPSFVLWATSTEEVKSTVHFTATCAFLAEIAKNFGMIIINISRLVKKIGGRPPVVRSMSSSWLARRHLLWVEVASLPWGFPPKTKHWSHQALPWPLLARAFSLWPPEGQRAPDKRTLSLCLWAASLLWWDGKRSGVSGTPSAAHPDSNRGCVGQRHRAVDGWSWKGGNLSF